jgi:hypothetical protein
VADYGSSITNSGAKPCTQNLSIASVVDIFSVDIPLITE